MGDGISIVERDGKIFLNESQSFNQDTLLRKYRNEKHVERMLEAQIEKAPKQIEEHKGEKEIREGQLKDISERVALSEKIFNKRGINPSEELKKLREKYSDKELGEKAKIIHDKMSFEVKDMGSHILRTTKNEISLEEEVILYASNRYSMMQIEEVMTSIDHQIEKMEARLEVQRNELEKIQDSLKSIESYFKKKRLDLDNLLDKQAQNRKKEEKVAEELPIK